jgi:hypothetical protein
MPKIVPMAAGVDYELLPICPACKVIVQAKSGDQFCQICGTGLETHRQRIVRCACAPDRELAFGYCTICGTHSDVLAQRLLDEQAAAAKAEASRTGPPGAGPWMRR